MKVKRKLTVIDTFFVCINISFSAALLLSYLAPVTNPAKHWMFAFFGLGYPVILLCNLIFVIYWLMRKSIWVLLPVICIATGWGILNKNIGLRPLTKAALSPGLNTVHIMTYNVHNFKRYGANKDISTKHEMLAIIADKQPDVIGFQEFYTRKHGQYAMVDSICKILNTGSYYFEANETNRFEAVGMAMFSKFPIVAHGLIQLADKTSDNQCIYIDVKKGSQTIRIYSVHLQSIGFDPEDYQYLAGIIAHGKTDMTATKRLFSKLKSAFIRRSLQVTRIKADADTCPYPYIISGDFNDTPTSYAVNQMGKGLKNAFSEKGSGMGRTYNGDFPNFQIDYIMASRQFNVLDYDIVEKKLSDHYPVCSHLQLKTD